MTVDARPSESESVTVSELVSVVMPVYNGEKYLAEALQSVLDQSHTAWELIVVDDGSTDATAQIVAEVKDARIRYVYQSNRGQAAALNRGLDLAQGAYVTTLDADDRFSPDSLRDRVQWLKAHPEHGAVYADGYFCNPALEPTLRFSQDRTVNVDGDIYSALINTPLFGTGACVLIRTAVLQHWRIRYDEDIVMCQDWDFYIRVAERVQFGYVDQISVYYRVHPENMTLTIARERHINSIIRTRLKVLDTDRFGALASAEKVEFLRRLLVNTLKDRTTEQEAVLRSPRVAELPPADRARLLRWLATEWFLSDALTGRAQALMRTAQTLAPHDPKTAGLAWVMGSNAGLAKRALWAWRSLRPGSIQAQLRQAAESRRENSPPVRPWR